VARYPEKYGVDGSNGTLPGQAKFSPVRIAGVIVPAMCAGGTLDVAFMETVWHGAPTPSDGFHLVLNESTETRRVGS